VLGFPAMFRGVVLLPWLCAGALAASPVPPQTRLQTLQTELAALPTPLRGPIGGTLGYASEVFPGPGRDAFKWAGVDLGVPRQIDGIALAPSWMIGADRTERSHGFPAQFRVETSLDPEFSQPRVVFESGPAFPDPGRHPVWIELQPHSARCVRVVATKLRSSFFGLSELFVFSGERNIALGAPALALDKISLNPNWSPAHLSDGFTPLGLPTGVLVKSRECFRSAPLPGELEPSWLEVTLAQQTELSALALVPAAWISNLARIQQLGEGFPLAFRVEVAAGAGPWRKVFEHGPEERQPFPNPSNLAWYCALPETTQADRVRVTATRHLYNEAAAGFYLALSEIQLLDAEGRNVALNAEVTSSHPPKTNRIFGPKRVVDGYSSEGSLLPVRDWLKALDRRRRLLLEIESLQTEVELRATSRARLLKTLAWTAGLLLAGAAAGQFWHARRTRARREAQLREKIAQDLHDEIGSTLGSISLYADGLSHRATSQDQTRLIRVAEMARDASQTMRDLVWVIDERSDNSENLFDRLRETAGRLLGDLHLDFEAPTGEKTAPISPEQKRHLLLFVKEALHNVLRHAGASEVAVRIRSEPEHWLILVEDNGRGFERENPGGSQLEKLYARAARLRGKLEVDTAPGKGTRLRLTAPRKLSVV
jgi:signal transduction histidine kinase